MCIYILISLVCILIRGLLQLSSHFVLHAHVQIHILVDIVEFLSSAPDYPEDFTNDMDLY